MVKVDSTMAPNYTLLYPLQNAVKLIEAGEMDAERTAAFFVGFQIHAGAELVGQLFD